MRAKSSKNGEDFKNKYGKVLVRKVARLRTFSLNFKNITQNGQNQSCDTFALKRRFMLFCVAGCVDKVVPFEADVSLSKLWAEAEAKAGNVEGVRRVWNDLLAQSQYTGRSDLWLQFIAMERLVRNNGISDGGKV